MREIPEDVLIQAEMLCPAVFSPAVRVDLARSATVASIAKAIIAERERCARIAAYEFISSPESEWDQGYNVCSDDIECLIRSGKVEGGPTAAVRPTPINAINQPNEDKPASGEEEKLHV